MGLWSAGIRRSKGLDDKATEEAETEEEKALWEERHFQICLALISRTDLDSRISEPIIRRADKMTEALKAHYRKK